LKSRILHFYGVETVRHIRRFENLRIKKTKLLTSLTFLLITALLPLKMERIESSETSVYINQTPGSHPKERIQQDWLCE